MILTRWKMLAGVLGLSMCGLAALAEPACRTVGHRSYRHDTPAEVSELPVLPPIPGSVVPAPVPPPLPVTPPTPVTPTAPVAASKLPLPELPSAEESSPVTPPMTLPPVSIQPEISPALDVEAKPVVTLPEVVSPTPPASNPKPALPILPLPTPTVPTPTPVPGSNLPIITTQGTPDVPNNPVELNLPKPVVTQEPAPIVSSVERRTPSAAAEKRLRVQLELGGTSPRFEISDGDDIVLKVISEKVDVQSPSQQGELWSTLKAHGSVKFRTPGGDGYCDELQILPGTCEVIATGNVRFTYNWGKLETAVRSERMIFKLGTTPE